MGRSETKFQNTAARMDEALLELIEEKDFETITIKEICEKAEVNRSTFYLHYESVMDLLDETIRYMGRQFLSYFPQEGSVLKNELSDPENLSPYLITPEYLTPYLQYIYDHKRIYLTTVRETDTLASDKSMKQLYETVLDPILDRYRIPESRKKYLIAYYIEGIIAVVKVWIKGDCEDPIEEITDIIMQCVPKPDTP